MVTKKKTTKKKSVGRGRPTKYRKEYCQLLEDHMASGLSLESFGGVVGVCEDTVHEWCKKHADFSESKRKGVAASRVFWEKLGVDHIVNRTDSIRNPDGSTQSKSRSLNSSAWIFNMKNRFGWRDKKDIELDGDLDFNLNYNLDDDE